MNSTLGNILFSGLFRVQISGEFLALVSAGFLVIIIALLCYIGVYVFREIRRKAIADHLINIYANLISDIILCESKTELHNSINQPYIMSIMRKWLTRPLGREVLINQLVTNHRSLSGKAGENLVWLYEWLKLNEDSIRMLSSTKWYKKALAIQALAELQQRQSLTRLYKETNAGTYLVRAEAQIAVVKLSGFAGLRFLNVISLPVTQWQQLCLLNQLPMPDESQYKNMENWLRSDNETIVEFTLKIIERFQLVYFHDRVGKLLQHALPVVRCQAINTLKAIATEETCELLMVHFANAPKNEKLLVLRHLAEIGSAREAEFIETVIRNSNGIVQSVAAAHFHQMQQFLQNGILPGRMPGIEKSSGSIGNT